MKRIIVLLVAALLSSAVVADAQTPPPFPGDVYTRDVMVFAGNDSLYKASNSDSTTFELPFTSSALVAVNTNWLDISQLWVPPFYESYCDTTWTTVTSGYRDASGTGVATNDSLIVPRASSTSYHSWPIAMRISAAVSSAAATVDTVWISVHVSNDKQGYRVAWMEPIEPSKIGATTAELLADASTTKRVCSVPAGKLYGWKYMRVRVLGDGNHKAGLACKLYHYYRMYAVPDKVKRNINATAR